jgi:hypothetical protein
MTQTNGERSRIFNDPNTAGIFARNLQASGFGTLLMQKPDGTWLLEWTDTYAQSERAEG